MSNVSVLGLGAMGSRMAVNLRRAGHEVTVWNRTPQVAEQLAATHGLRSAATPGDAAVRADVVISMVTDDAAAVDVWTHQDHGALAAMADGSVAVESSTLTTETVRRLDVAATAAGVRFVEAPVVGSRPQADAGALFVLVAGDDDAVAAAEPIIEVNAAAIRHLGPIGNAATMKLAINGLFAAQVAAYAEVAGMLERSGVDTTDALDVLAGLPITSPGLQRILGLIANGDHSPNFPIHLVAKDLDYLGEEAERLDADVPVMAATRSVFERAAGGGERDLDISGIARRYRR